MSAVPMKIVHVASGDLWAGAEVQLYQLARALQRRSDNELHVILLNHGALEDKLRHAGVAVEVVEEQKQGTWTLVAQLRRRLMLLQPSIIHSHRYKENFLVALASRGMPVVRVRTMHGAPDAMCGLRARAVAVADKFSARFQRAAVCVSPELVERVHQRFPRLPTVVIENGIYFPELEQAARRPIDESMLGEGIRVGFAGRMEKVKRPDLFVATAHPLARRFPGRFSFHLFGDGPLMNLCRQFIERHRLESQVRLLGFQSEIAAWLAHMDILVICSDHEGLPMVLLEAMGLGVPVVAHAVGGIPHVLAMGAYGSLVREQTPDSYGDALTYLADHSQEYLSKAWEARRHVQAHYSIESIAGRYMELYRQLTAVSVSHRRIVYD